MLHGFVLLVAVGLTLRSRPHTTFVTLAPIEAPHLPRMPAYRGAKRGRGPAGGLGQPPSAPAPAPSAPSAPPPAPAAPAAAVPAAAAAAVLGPFVDARTNDLRVWPGPRNSLPREVAEVLYDPRDTTPRDTVVKHRLRAMVDSLQHVIDLAERDRKAPSWTTEVGGKKFGIDSANIYIAGIKIPTPVLALLGSNLPQGNFDEAMRERQIADMRRDIMQAAERTQTMHEFQQYVRELRARKQAERDAARRQVGDTGGVVGHEHADTVHAIP
jgi:hypothetical protein